MIREYIEGHDFNSTAHTRLPIPPHERVWIIKGAIRCDGVAHAFSAWGHTLPEAQEEFDSFLNKECTCVFRSDPNNCTIHRRAA
jgi:hypothetical protein